MRTHGMSLAHAETDSPVAIEYKRRNRSRQHALVDTGSLAVFLPF